MTDLLTITRQQGLRILNQLEMWFDVVYGRTGTVDRDLMEQIINLKLLLRVAEMCQPDPTKPGLCFRSENHPGGHSTEFIEGVPSTDMG